MQKTKNKIINYKCNISLNLIDKYEIVSIDYLKKDLFVDMIIWNNNEKFKEEYFDKFPNLRLFVNWGTATSNLPDLDQFSKRFIQLKTVKGYSTNAVSEHVVYTLMQLFSRSRYKRKELNHKKIGIIGMGNIGVQTMKLLQGFNCDISYFSKTKKDINIPFCSLEKLIKSSDALVIAVDSNNFKIPIESLKMAQTELVICNISQDFILPAFKVIESVKNGIIPHIDIISDNFATKEILESYGRYYTPHIAYKSMESSLEKNNMLEEYINLL